LIQPAGSRENKRTAYSVQNGPQRSRLHWGRPVADFESGV